MLISVIAGITTPVAWGAALSRGWTQISVPEVADSTNRSPLLSEVHANTPALLCSFGKLICRGVPPEEETNQIERPWSCGRRSVNTSHWLSGEGNTESRNAFAPETPFLASILQSSLIWFVSTSRRIR